MSDRYRGKLYRRKLPLSGASAAPELDIYVQRVTFTGLLFRGQCNDTVTNNAVRLGTALYASSPADRMVSLLVGRSGDCRHG